MRAQYMLFPVFALAFFTSCLDPVHQDAVDALGDEVDGIPRGPTHRAGQTCTVCHGGKGPGSPDISIGGTIYDTRYDGTSSLVALNGVTVTVTDAANTTKSAVSNSVGNFYFFTSDFDPKYPLHVTLTGSDGIKHDMKTRIGGDAGCARCHQGAGDQGHMPAVYLHEEGQVAP